MTNLKTLENDLKKQDIKKTWQYRANNIHKNDIVVVSEKVSDEGGWIYAYYFVVQIKKPKDIRSSREAYLWPLAKKSIVSQGIFKTVKPRIADHGCIFTDFEQDLRDGAKTKVIEAYMADDNHIRLYDRPFFRLTEAYTATKWHHNADTEKV